MKRLIVRLAATAIMWLGILGEAVAESKSEENSSLLRVYEVNKRVKDFPEKEDLSTPEAAYAVARRLSASGESFRRISVKSLARRLPPPDAKKKEVKPEVAEGWLNALILEVRIFRGTHAAVIAKLPPAWRSPFDMRTVDLEAGRWLNVANSRWDSMREAREFFARSCARYVEKPVRPRIDDPDAYLKPFVEFLKNRSEEPKAFVMKTISRHKVVIMGEMHHRPRYWAFNASLVTDGNFPKHVGVIYLELPSNDQQLVNKFLAAEECDTMPVIEMLRDNLWMGWPDQAMLDFFITVWMVNQNLPAEERLRIVLVDMKRPWKDIQKREDWGRYNVDRDAFMAENILEDMKKHSEDKRNALFIVGVGHTALNLKYFEGSPWMTAGWHLREALGLENIYAIMQHRCVMTNMGRVDGRLCLGLFDSAFAALDNKHLAFPLDAGPFGKEPFDADPDRPVSSTFGDGFNAYLYLGPLEHEIFSPLIAGFYTDEFVKELDRRYQMMFGRGLVKGCRLRRLDAESFIGWMGSWGKPRRRWTSNTLGPLNAWHYGSDWKKTIRDEKHKRALEHPEEIREAARELFEAIRTADYDRDWLLKDAWQKFPPGAGDYMVHHDAPAWVQWACKTFKENPIVSAELGEVFRDADEYPCIPYKLTLKDGKVLVGDLPFYYDPTLEHWIGREGIDWHLKYPDGLPEKK